MTSDDDSGEDAVGRGKPPRSGRFPPGHTRSRGKRRKRGPKPLPYEAVFGQLVTVQDADGTPMQITLEEAVRRHLRRLGLLGYLPAQEQLLRAAREIRRHLPDLEGDDITYVEVNNWLGSVNDVVLPLEMARKIDPFGTNPIILIEPWLVERALARLDRQLTIEEQRIVWDATLTPKRVGWPDWWTERRGTGIPRKKRGLQHGGFYAPCVRDAEGDGDGETDTSW